MAITVDGKTIELTASGFLADQADWSEKTAVELARTQDVELTERHWDVINYLRDEYFNNNENQPNTRTIVKAMKQVWKDDTVSANSLYKLFPKDPSKQAGLIAGIPESRRKGGY